MEFDLDTYANITDHRRAFLRRLLSVAPDLSVVQVLHSVIRSPTAVTSRIGGQQLWTSSDYNRCHPCSPQNGGAIRLVVGHVAIVVIKRDNERVKKTFPSQLVLSQVLLVSIIRVLAALLAAR